MRKAEYSEIRNIGWEYEALFDVKELTAMEQLMTEAAAPSLWRSHPSDIAVGMLGYRTKTTKAGDMLEFDIYPIFGRSQEQQARKAMQRVTPERMQRVNDYNAKRRIVQLANANFGPKDIHLTLTYLHAPEYEQAQKDVRNFLAKVKRLRKRKGLPELKYIYAIEGNEEDWKERIHVHMLISGGISREELERMWARGYANADRLQPDEHGLAKIARYLTKHQRNRRRWCASKNLKKPQVRVSDTKLSCSKIKRIARELPNEAKDILRKAYPGYEYVECQVHHSDHVDGVYIRGLMRRIHPRYPKADKSPA